MLAQVSSQPGGGGGASDQAAAPSGSGLLESEDEPTAVSADDSVYTSAERFEDLHLHKDLLKARP